MEFVFENVDGVVNVDFVAVVVVVSADDSFFQRVDSVDGDRTIHAESFVHDLVDVSKFIEVFKRGESALKFVVDKFSRCRKHLWVRDQSVHAEA